jgi:glucan phosphoethanolaminetransferase (alkaline phosphatase superfamily)
MTLPRLWTLWLPLLLLAFQFVLEFSFSSAELAVLMSENGPIELLQFIPISIAFVVALAMVCRLFPLRRPALFIWVLVAALACFYVAGEEVSWGQHFLHWNTPEYWKALNDQQETNLHNTSAWLDQKPRLILLIGIIAGGIIIPLLQRYRPVLLPEKFSIIYPAATLMPVALLVLGPYLAQEFAEHFFERGIFQRDSELQELYMYYFVLLYLVMLQKRIPSL